jgi:hypothetical protein
MMPSWNGHINQYMIVTRSFAQKPLLRTIQDLFDLIHFRAVAQGITNSKWPQVLKEAYRCVKPGAYVELSESDSKLQKNFCLARVTEPYGPDTEEHLQGLLVSRTIRLSLTNVLLQSSSDSGSIRLDHAIPELTLFQQCIAVTMAP